MTGKFSVIIPSAKIVSKELQNIGKLPAVIYPVNKGIVFDYLFDQYNKNANSIDVICYENSEKVHRRLNKYDSSKVHIRDLDKIGDLGQTIYFGIKDLQEPFVINFGDTIVQEDITKLQQDSFYYASDYMSDTWTFFDIKDKALDSIIDKVDSSNLSDKKGNLFVGVFAFSSPELLKCCLEEAFLNRKHELSCFYQALQLYSKKIPLEPIYTDKWFDIGHLDRYYDSTLEVKAREFNHIVIDKDRGILRKTSDNVDKFIGEIKWYLKLPSDIEYVRPRIFDYSTSYIDPFVSMEYYSYHTLHELFLYGDLNRKQWKDIFSRISFVCKDFRRYTVKDSGLSDAIEDTYLTKTLQRLNEIRNNTNFSRLFDHEIIINGITYLSLEKIINRLKILVPNMLYDVDEFCIIHGDLCFSNIMVDSNLSFVKLIDPRGKFGKYDIYGDQRYELAKLFHSIDGKYDFIIKDLFDLSYDEEKVQIDFKISDRVRDFDIYKVFLESFSSDIGNDIKKIELIEALLFLSMIPLHSESVNQQIVMLATGISILNRIENFMI